MPIIQKEDKKMNLNQNLSYYLKLWKEITRHKVGMDYMVEFHCDKGYTILHLIGGKGCVVDFEFDEESSGYIEKVVSFSEISDKKKDGLIKAVAAYVLGILDLQDPKPTNYRHHDGPVFMTSDDHSSERRRAFSS